MKMTLMEVLGPHTNGNHPPRCTNRNQGGANGNDPHPWYPGGDKGNHRFDEDLDLFYRDR